MAGAKEFYDNLPIEDLNARHKRIIQMHAQGMKNIEIAEVLGIDKMTVALVVNSPAAQAKIVELQDKIEDAIIEQASDPLRRARDVLENAVEAAAGTLVSLLQAGKEEIQLGASKEILDRVGVSKHQSVASGGITLQFNDTQNLLLALKESGGDSNAVLATIGPANSDSPLSRKAESLLSG